MLVLQPFLQPELGLMMFKPGKTLLNELVKMSQGNRLLVMPLPEQLVNVPSGKVKGQKSLSSTNSTFIDDRLVEFFLNPEVHRKMDKLENWVDRIPHCQLSDGEYCDKNLTVLQRESGFIKVCWHHDNEETSLPSDKSEGIAKKNLFLWANEQIKYRLRKNQNDTLSLSEICWWSVVCGVYEYLPREITDEVLGIEKKGATSTLNPRRWESDERWERDSKESLSTLVKSVDLNIDEEPPAMFMARPKETTWRCDKYLKFVRSLPCIITGKTEDVVAHHLIGHGEGKMGGKTHDLFTMPMHSDEHRKFHDDPKGWEERHGSQLFYVKQTINKALHLGAIS